MKTIHSDQAPQAIGPYSQAQVVRLHGGQKLVYTAGQVALDPGTSHGIQERQTRPVGIRLH